MNRRTSIRNAVLFAVGMALGKLDTLKAQEGMLTVPLDNWKTVVFQYKGKRVEVPVSEVFNAVAEVGTVYERFPHNDHNR